MSKINLNLDFDAIRKRIDKEKDAIKPSVWADKVGVSRNIITNIHGKVKQKPSLEYIVAVSIATNKSIEYYLWGKENPVPKTIQSPYTFLDKARADRIIKNLSKLEQIGERGYTRAEAYIDGCLDAARLSSTCSLSSLANTEDDRLPEAQINTKK